MDKTLLRETKSLQIFQLESSESVALLEHRKAPGSPSKLASQDLEVGL